MRRILCLVCCFAILLCSCTAKPLSSLFPDNEILSDMGKSYDAVNSVRDLESRVDYENPYTYPSLDSIPGRYTCAVKSPVTVSNVEFTPVYSFISSDAPLSGLVEVFYNYNGDSLSEEDFLNVINQVHDDFYTAYGDLRPMYGFENDLADFLKLSEAEQLKKLNSENMLGLASYWTVKESFSSNPRVDLFAKLEIIVSASSGKKNYTINVRYVSDIVEDWEKDWLENPTK